MKTAPQLIKAGKQRTGTRSRSMRQYLADYWERLKTWFGEPIDFPGKWPEFESRPGRYNSEGSHECDNYPQTLNERRPTQS